MTEKVKWEPPPERTRLKWAGVDLDGTLAENVWRPGSDPREIGAPIERNVRKLHAMVDAGYKIFIHTSRPWEQYENIQLWLDRHRVPYREIQCGKPLYACYVDDRAVHADAPSWIPVTDEQLGRVVPIGTVKHAAQIRGERSPGRIVSPGVEARHLRMGEDPTTGGKKEIGRAHV